MTTIVQDGDPVLRLEAEEVPATLFGTPELMSIIDHMKDALDAQADGVALAAPQIGVSLRMFMVRYDRLQNHPAGTPVVPSVGIYINPDFTRTSRKRDLLEEGCLSVRGIYGHTHRFERASVRAQDERGKFFERGAGGLLAQIFQHEIDHLNGVLFIDHAIDLYEYKSAAVTGEVAADQGDISMPIASPRFAYFGTPYVARDTLHMLADKGFMPSVVITSPDAARGRGLSLTPSETNAWAIEHDIPVLTPEVLDAAAIEEIAQYDCLFGVAVAYGKILPQALIDLFPLGIVNVHYSLLPKYRGASPVEAALLHGDTETGVTIQQMAFKLDAGAILAQEKIAIDPLDTTLELRPKLIMLGAELLIKTLPDLYGGKAVPVPQNDALATHAPKIKKEEGLLRIGSVDEAVINWKKYRAYKESPGTYFFATKSDQRIRVKIHNAQFASGKFTPTRIVPEGKAQQPFSYLEQNGWVAE